MKVILFANTDWYLYNFRLSLAETLRAGGCEVVLVSPAGRYTQQLRRAGFRVVDFPLGRRRLNPLVEFVAVLRLVRLYTRERPDAVHHFTLKCVLYGSVAARLTGVGAVINALTGLGHVFSARGRGAAALRALASQVMRLFLKGTQVIFQNPDDRREFLARGLVSERDCHLIRGSGVDVRRFSPTRRERPGRRVLFASRLLRSKGVAEYVEAARLVRRRVPDALFVLAGDADEGNPDAFPREDIARWKEEGQVEVLGHCDDMRELLGGSDLVVLPTSYGEGVPRILVEAAACGKALIATDHRGCREIVVHGSNGLLIPPRDAGALAEAIESLLSDECKREEMGRRSRELACGKYSQEKVNAETLGVYRIALRGGDAGLPALALTPPAAEEDARFATGGCSANPHPRTRTSASDLFQSQIT